jgi:hypothetical protein
MQPGSEPDFRVLLPDKVNSVRGTAGIVDRRYSHALEERLLVRRLEVDTPVEDRMECLLD